MVNYVERVQPRTLLSPRLELDETYYAHPLTELYRLLRVKLAATTADHPQGDGQTKWVNQELEQFLYLFINQRQDDWDDLLLIVKFQYNNHIHSATQNIPFLLDTGQIPHMGFEPDQGRSNLESVNEFKEQMESALKEVKVALTKSKDDMTKYYDQKRTPAPDYQPRDKVYLDTSDIQRDKVYLDASDIQRDKVYLDASDIQMTRPSKKLSHQRLGPFPVVRKVGNGTYQLQLPPSMSQLHLVFNVVT